MNQERNSQFLGKERITRKTVRHSDEARASYYRSVSERTWGDRRNYELMMDSSIGIEASVDTICHYIRSREQHSGAEGETSAR